MRSVYRVPATGSWYRSHSLLFLKRNKKHLTFQSPWNILIAEEENPRGPSSAMAQEPLILGWASSFFTHLRGKAEAFSSCLVQHTAFIMLGRQPLAVKKPGTNTSRVRSRFCVSELCRLCAYCISPQTRSV